MHSFIHAKKRSSYSQNFQNAIVSLHVYGNRVLVGDQQDAVQFAVYKAPENRLIVFADDTQQRWTTACTMVDYETLAAGDKFGNFWLSRLPSGVSDDVDADPTGGGLVHEKALFNGAAHKLQLVSHYNVGDIITSLHRVPLVAGGREMLVYTGLCGTLGMMVPLQSREDVDFFQTLEMHMRGEAPSLVGRDHLAYRGCKDGITISSTRA